MTRDRLTQYIADYYSTLPDFPWAESPESAVFRHSHNRKWFALVMSVRKDRLGLEGTDSINVVNLKCDPLMIGSLRTLPGIFPAYHMNKSTWISIALDGSADSETIKMLLDISWELTGGKAEKPKKTDK